MVMVMFSVFMIKGIIEKKEKGKNNGIGVGESRPWKFGLDFF